MAMFNRAPVLTVVFGTGLLSLGACTMSTDESSDTSGEDPALQSVSDALEEDDSAASVFTPDGTAESHYGGGHNHGGRNHGGHRHGGHNHGGHNHGGHHHGGGHPGGHHGHRHPWGWPGAGRPVGGWPASGELCGESICGSGEYCCNASCNICMPVGGACSREVCDDDSAADVEAPSSLDDQNEGR